MDKIIKILEHRGYSDLARLLSGARYEIDQSSTYGTYLFSLLSTVEIYAPLQLHDELISLAEEKKQAILDAFLTLYPPKDHSIEITNIEFYVDPDMEFEVGGVCQISEVTRKNLLDELILLDENQRMLLSGKLDLVEFLKRVWPLDNMPSTDSRFKTASGDIWQHMINNDDWSYHYLFDDYLSLLRGTDEQFLCFLEQLIHPLVRGVDEQEEYVSVVNGHLKRDGFRLEAREQISGYPVYRAVRIDAGVQERVKNLIFAADGPKPEIVLSDSLSNEIQIVRNAKYCLVYDLPIRDTGLRWSELVAWWADLNESGDITTEIERDLYRRLMKSLQSAPEQLLFRTYFEAFRSKLGDNLPALIPQVYLHYDPYTFRELKGSKRLPRQRMDFLILFSNHERIVIEVDGKQHYADENRANPRKYAVMVAADRGLRLAGYEIYRFGGHELQGSSGKKLVEEFFRKLLQKHGIAVS